MFPSKLRIADSLKINCLAAQHGVYVAISGFSFVLAEAVLAGWPAA